MYGNRRQHAIKQEKEAKQGTTKKKITRRHKNKDINKFKKNTFKAEERKTTETRDFLMRTFAEHAQRLPPTAPHRTAASTTKVRGDQCTQGSHEGA